MNIEVKSVPSQYIREGGTFIKLSLEGAQYLSSLIGSDRNLKLFKNTRS